MNVWIVSSYRYGIGTDYFMYEDISIFSSSATSIKSIMDRFELEPGWAALNWITAKIFNDPKVIFAISSFIFLFCAYKMIAYYVDRISVGMSIFILLILCYLPSFNAVRQYVAIGILMLSFKYIENKRLIKFFILVFIATIFHYTALVFIPIYFILYKKISKTKIAVIIGGAFTIILGYNFIISTIISISPAFEKYERYLYTGNGQFNMIMFLFQAIIVSFILLAYNPLKNSNYFMYNLVYVFFISIVVSFLGNMVLFVGRISYYFEISLIILIPYICKNIVRAKDKPIIYTIIIILFILYWYITFIYSGNHQCVPYISI